MVGVVEMARFWKVCEGDGEDIEGTERGGVKGVGRADVGIEDERCRESGCRRDGDRGPRGMRPNASMALWPLRGVGAESTLVPSNMVGSRSPPLMLCGRSSSSEYTLSGGVADPYRDTDGEGYSLSKYGASASMGAIGVGGIYGECVKMSSKGGGVLV